MAISGLGMCSSIGYDVKTACASYRAGLSRPAELKGLEILSMDEFDTIPVTGLPISGLTDGFVGAGLLINLARNTLQDLFNYSNIDTGDLSFFKETGFYIALSPVRDENYEFYDDIIEKTLLFSVARNIGVEFNSEHQKIFFNGNTAVLAAAKEAAAAINRGDVKRIIILGIDSLVGKADLEFFSLSNRLKTPDTTNGLIPGEAGAAFIIESETASNKRGAEIQAYLHSIESSVEENSISSEKPNIGTGLSKAICKTVKKCDYIYSVYCDQNGELWRALEYGNALVKISLECNVENISAFLPAESFGDTGAASGAISICTAIRSFCRNYSVSDDILIYSSSDNGEVISAIVSNENCTYREMVK